MVTIEEIKERCLLLDLSPTKLAELSGLAQTTVARAFSDGHEPLYSTVMKMVAAIRKYEDDLRKVLSEVTL